MTASATRRQRMRRRACDVYRSGGAGSSVSGGGLRREWVHIDDATGDFRAIPQDQDGVRAGPFEQEVLQLDDDRGRERPVWRKAAELVGRRSGDRFRHHWRSRSPIRIKRVELQRVFSLGFLVRDLDPDGERHRRVNDGERSREQTIDPGTENIDLAVWSLGNPVR